jgi:uncharacterized protein YjbI with pentapeptide repeats
LQHANLHNAKLWRTVLENANCEKLVWKKLTYASFSIKGC